ncbi:MAG: M56 family metallopeptidase [Acidobacteriota bacterium]|nr:M56 family metallopeptidase [Acidobacteriota bacterium]
MSTLNLLLENLDPLAQLLLQAFFRTLWQGILIVTLVWLLLRVFKHISATTRHAVWLASLLMIAALPFVAIATKRTATTAALPQPQKTQIQQPTISFQPPTIPPVAVPQNVVELAPPSVQTKQASPRIVADYDRAATLEEIRRIVSLSESASVMPATIQTAKPVAPVVKKSFWQRTSNWFFDSRWPLALSGIWLLAAMLMFGRLAHSYYMLLVMRRSMLPAGQNQQARVERLANQFGIRRFVLLFTSSKVTVPMTIGALKPVIVLPPNLAGHLSISEFDSVVAHELAHIRRWDYLINLLQRLAQAFLFFHPAVWFIGRQLMIERELACDDWAVKMCEPRRYASCLTRLVEMLGDSRPLAAAAGILFGKHVISRRVEMILNRERNATTAVSKPAVAYAIGMAALLVAACSLLSPVVAVPLGQQKARQQKKEAKAPAPAVAQTVPLPPLPPEPLPADLLIEAAVADLLEAPLPVLPPDMAEPAIAALDEAMLTALIQDAPKPAQAPAAPGTGIGGGIGGGISGGVGGGISSTGPIGGVAWAPTATTIGGWDQDDKKKTPAIPETELLNLLVDIVKKDSAPNVRNEALQGIYRLRSEAASNALVSLYDSISDPKAKGEIIAYLLRREGDNSKAIAKLTQIAKTETNEELRNRAIRYLGNVKGDEGATNLIQIYDTVQDAKTKQYLIRSLAYNKSPKAIEKLKQIAKNDTDPQVRSSAIRSLYSIDSRLYVDTIPPGQRIGMVEFDRDLFAPRVFEFDGKAFEFDAKRWEDMTREWELKWKENQGKYKELMEKMQIEGLDKLRLEMPKIELKLKELNEKLKLEKDVNLISPTESLIRSQISQLTAQLAAVSRNNAGSSAQPTIQETISLLNSLQRQLGRSRPIRAVAPRPAVAPSYRTTPTPRATRQEESGSTASTTR